MQYRNICQVSHCEKYIHTQGFCSKHYFRMKVHGSPTYKKIVPANIKRTARLRVQRRCRMDSCYNEAYAKSLCKKHYARWYHNGDPNIVKKVKGENRTANPLYKAYHAMLDRCNNPENTHYEYYGGRGLTVCERWTGHSGFSNFIKDVGERPSGKSLDRIDNNKGYSPENCRWADKPTQQHNQRISIMNTSGYKGVHYYKKNDKWTAYINTNGKRKHLGYFANKKDAIRARKAAEKEI